MSDEKSQKKFPILAGNEMSEVHAFRRPRYTDGLPAVVTISNKFGYDLRATFALSCIEKWGMVAGEASGEDSAGRQKMRRATPAEIASHACDCAEAAFTEFEKRKWQFKLPTLEEAIDSVKDQENSND